MWVNHNSTRIPVLGGFDFERQRFLREELMSCKKGHDNGTTTEGGGLRKHKNQDNHAAIRDTSLL